MAHHLHTGLTIASQALRALRRFPDRTAFVTEGGRLSYTGATDLISRYQAVFDGQGFRRGQRVALLSENTWESWCAGIAAQGLGMSVTFLHPKGSLEDQAFQIDDSEAHALIVDARTHGERAGQLFERVGAGRTLLSVGASSFAPDLTRLADKIGAATAVDIASPEEVALLHYTGGTTGRSKGALRSNRAAVAFGAYTVMADLDIPAAPQYLAVAPNSHAGGTMLLPTFRKGGTVHFVDKFDPELILRRIARDRISFSFVVPTMIYALLDAPGLASADLSSLSYVFYGAAAASPPKILEAMERIGPVFAQGYGQTECYLISVLRPEDHDPARPELLSSCGMPVATCEVRLLDSDGKEVPWGEPGEICARTPGSMDGYWKRPELTAETLAGGWVHTGDVARLDERGFLYIVDRKKDLVITGGFNVYPREVEDALASHAAVSLSAVVGVPDERWGEAVAAAVVLKPGAAVDRDALAAHVKERKGPLATPKRIEFVEQLPVTSLGKIDKVALRAQFSEKTQSVDAAPGQTRRRLGAP